MMVPQDAGTPGDAPHDITDDVVGIMTNGVLLDSHSQTWEYDMCNGHSDGNDQYHYHIPPICYLKSMGVPVPESDKWWISDDGKEVRAYGDMHKQFPETGSSPVVGWARDGFPIKALYGPDGKLVRSALYGGDLDECNGMGEGADYAYYITAEPPFVPTCFKGKMIGEFTSTSSDKTCPANGITNTIAGVEVPSTPTPGPPAGGTPSTPTGDTPSGDNPADDTPTGDSGAPPAPSAAYSKIPFLGALVSIVLATLVLM